MSDAAAGKSTCCRECANRKEGKRMCAADLAQCQRTPDACNDLAEAMSTAPNKCFSCGDFKPKEASAHAR